METSTRIRRIALTLSVLVAAAILLTQRPVPARPELAIRWANAEQAEAIDWALGRYRTAGLDGMPPLEIRFHASAELCDGGIGLYHAGRIDLCTKDSSEPYQRKFALHEMAHAWTEANVGADILGRFMEGRAIAAWNDRSLPWKARGTEQAAEIITWGLGDGEIAPLLPEAADTDDLAELFEMLTGRRPITPAAL